MVVQSILATACSNNSLETSITIISEDNKEDCVKFENGKNGFICLEVEAKAENSTKSQSMRFSEFPFKEFSSWCQTEEASQEDATKLVILASHGSMSELEFDLIQRILLAVVSEHDQKHVKSMRRVTAFIFVKNGKDVPIFECHSDACALHLKQKQGQEYVKHSHPGLNAEAPSKQTQEVVVGRPTTHTVTLKNTGRVPWPRNVALVHYLDAKEQQNTIKSVPEIPALLPNNTADISIGVIYNKLGTERIVFKLATPEGSIFGDEIRIDSNVAPAPKPTPTPAPSIALQQTPTPTPQSAKPTNHHISWADYIGDRNVFVKHLLAPVSALVFLSAIVSKNLQF